MSQAQVFTSVLDSRDGRKITRKTSVIDCVENLVYHDQEDTAVWLILIVQL